MFFVILLLIIILYLSFRIFINKHTRSVTCLIGKTALVTGGNSGLGYTTCLLLASRGCKVIIADKTNGEKSRDEMIKKTGNSNIIYKHLDLSSLENVREFSRDIINTEKKVDILINNAGIPASEEIKTQDGLNTVMQVNFFGGFLLTHLLYKLLKASTSGRIIFLGSNGMYFHQLKLDTLNDIRTSTNIRRRANMYMNSKLCNVLAAQEFAKKLKEHRISVYSADPSWVKTSMFGEFKRLLESPICGLILNLGFNLVAVDSFSGAQTILHLATSDEVLSKEETHYAYLRPFFKPFILKNQQFCDDIWRESEKLVKLKKEEKI